MKNDTQYLVGAVILVAFSVVSLVAAFQYYQSQNAVQLMSSSAESGCTDSDYGRNHFTYGSVTSGGSTYNDSCYTPTALYENYCKDGYRKDEYVTCPNGCSAGACAGSCYVGLSLKESKSGDLSVVFSAVESVTTADDASALVKKYSAENPSPFYVSVLDGAKNPLGKYKLWSGRAFTAQSFNDPPKGDINNILDSVSNVFFPLNRLARYAGLALGGSGTLAGTIPFDQNRFVCSVGTDNKQSYTSSGGLVTVKLPWTISYTLSVGKIGTGAGVVTGTGINCGSDCSESYNSGASVALTAAAASGSSFYGWSGACSGTGVCAVTMSDTKNVSSTFIKVK